jgi:hypothetical protein
MPVRFWEDEDVNDYHVEQLHIAGVVGLPVHTSVPYHDKSATLAIESTKSNASGLSAYSYENGTVTWTARNGPDAIRGSLDGKESEAAKVYHSCFLAMLLRPEFIVAYSREQKTFQDKQVFPMPGKETNDLIRHILCFGDDWAQWLNPQYKFSDAVKKNVDVFTNLLRCDPNDVLRAALKAIDEDADEDGDSRSTAIKNILEATNEAAGSSDGAVSIFHVAVAVRIFEFCWHVPFGESRKAELGVGGRAGAMYLQRSLNDKISLDELPAYLFQEVTKEIIDGLASNSEETRRVASAKARVLGLEYDSLVGRFRCALGVRGFADPAVFGEHFLCLLYQESSKCRPSRTISKNKQMDSPTTFPLYVLDGNGGDGVACEMAIMSSVKAVCSDAVEAYKELVEANALQPVPKELVVKQGSKEQREEWRKEQMKTAAGTKSAKKQGAKKQVPCRKREKSGIDERESKKQKTQKNKVRTSPRNLNHINYGDVDNPEDDYLKDY